LTAIETPITEYRLPITDYLLARTMPHMHSTHPVQAPAELVKFIRDIPDFPKPGILFRDITPLLGNPLALRAAVDLMALHYHGQPIEAAAAAEARGFIFAAPLAVELGIGFVPIRKRGKLPFKVHSFSYELEYGTDTVEMHQDALSPGHRVLLVDDLLATGGTMKACCELVEQTGATIAGCCFLVELSFLNGREKLAPYDVFSLIQYRS
jgi:adenine phosphoribosyltransferase